MSSRVLLASAAILLIGPLALSATVTEQAPVRRVAAAVNRPLEDQLLPDDSVVEFYFFAGEVDHVLPDRPYSRKQVLAKAVTEADQVLVLQLESADSKLIDEGRWIGTRLGFNVIEVMKVSHSRIRTGSNVAFEVGGGELRIKGVLVRIQSKVEYKIGQKYLAFLTSPKTPPAGLTSIIQGPHPRLLDGDRLKASSDPEDDLAGFTLSEVRRAVASAR